MRDSDVINHVKTLCKEKGWTYYRLAQEAGIPYSTLNNMLHRDNIPTVPTIQKMCDGMGITLADFFAEDIGDAHLTTSQKEILGIFAKLSPEDRKYLIAYGKGLARMKQ